MGVFLAEYMVNVTDYRNMTIIGQKEIILLGNISMFKNQTLPNSPLINI